MVCMGNGYSSQDAAVTAPYADGNGHNFNFSIASITIQVVRTASSRNNSRRNHFQQWTRKNVHNNCMLFIANENPIKQMKNKRRSESNVTKNQRKCACGNMLAESIRVKWNAFETVSIQRIVKWLEWWKKQHTHSERKSERATLTSDNQIKWNFLRIAVNKILLCFIHCSTSFDRFSVHFCFWWLQPCVPCAVATMKW